MGAPILSDDHNDDSLYVPRELCDEGDSFLLKAQYSFKDLFRKGDWLVVMKGPPRHPAATLIYTKLDTDECVFTDDVYSLSEMDRFNVDILGYVTGLMRPID